MKRYLEHIKSKPPHERRAHAMQISAGLVALMFVVWISTLSLRFTTPPQTADSDSNQTANVIGANGQNATLIVATTTGY